MKKFSSSFLAITIFMLFPFAFARANHIVVHGSNCLLELYDDHDTLIRSYPVGLGENGLGKTMKGDKKTPIGEYHILWKASRFWETDGGTPIIEEKTYFGKNNTVLFNPQGDFDGTPMWTDFFGGSEAVVMCLDYPNDSDLANGYSGHGITIQASLLGGIGIFVSRGGIRMNPSDARELYNLVEIGTKVLILAD